MSPIYNEDKRDGGCLDRVEENLTIFCGYISKYPKGFHHC